MMERCGVYWCVFQEPRAQSFLYPSAGATIVEHFDTETILKRESVPPCEAHGENNIS